MIFWLWFMQRLTARKGIDLYFAGDLEVLEQQECFRDVRAADEQAVIQEDHRVLVAEVPADPSAFFVGRNRQSVLVIRDVAHDLIGLLAERQQTALHGRHRDACARVRVQGEVEVVPVLEHRRVDRVTGVVQGVVPKYHIAVKVDFDEVGCSDLFEEQAERVYQVLIGRAGNASGEMGKDEVSPTVPNAQPIGGRKLRACLLLSC